MNFHKHRAFTLIELLVVIAIIGILAGFIFVSMSASITAAQDAKRKVDISNIQKAILMYEAAGGTLPDTGGVDCDLDPGNSSACDDFATKLQPYLKTIPTAPDGDFYVYNHDSSVDDTTFSIETTLSNDNTYGYSTSGGGGWYENPASPPPEEEGITFTEIAHVNSGGEANEISWAGDYVFLANGTDGLRVYKADENLNLTPYDHVDDGGTAMGVVFDGDGTVFLANGTDGVRTYSFDPYGETPALAPVAHINSGGSANSIYLTWYMNTKVFIANGSDGIRKYDYNGGTFTAIGHENTYPGQGLGINIYEAGPDYWIYLSNGTDGLRIFSQAISSNTFTYLDGVNDGGSAHRTMSAPDGAGIYMPNGSDGFRFYYYNGVDPFSQICHINDGGNALGVAYDDRYDYLANGTDGLRVYTEEYNEETEATYWQLAGHVNPGGEARSLFTWQSYPYIYIAVANGTDGIRLYRIDNPGPEGM
jgi:prepilin-type N-terminal cleavage/methylation domain-containing protein